MKYLLFILIAAATVFSCKNDPKGTGAGAGSVAGSKAEGWAEQPVPAESNRETALLTKDFWVFEFYVIPGDQEKSFFNRGLWYKLQMDGTFTYGHWEEYLGKGSWKLTYFQGTPILTIDSETDNSYDMFWELNFGNYQGFEASFVATRDSPQPGVMCKVINLMTRPTKKQFGYE